MNGRRYAGTNPSITRAMRREQASGYQSMPSAYTLTLQDGTTVTGVAEVGRRWAAKDDFRAYFNAMPDAQWATATVFVSGYGNVALRDVVKVS